MDKLFVIIKDKEFCFFKEDAPAVFTPFYIKGEVAVSVDASGGDLKDVIAEYADYIKDAEGETDFSDYHITVIYNRYDSVLIASIHDIFSDCISIEVYNLASVLPKLLLNMGVVEADKKIVVGFGETTWSLRISKSGASIIEPSDKKPDKNLEPSELPGALVQDYSFIFDDDKISSLTSKIQALEDKRKQCVEKLEKSSQLQKECKKKNILQQLNNSFIEDLCRISSEYKITIKKSVDDSKKTGRDLWGAVYLLANDPNGLNKEPHELKGILREFFLSIETNFLKHDELFKIPKGLK